MIKITARPLYRKAVNLFEKTGSWNELQMTQHCAERIGLIHYGVLSYKADVGFNALGLGGMAMIQNRDEIREMDHDFNTEHAHDHIKKNIEKASRFGLYHECWKWSWIALCKTKMSLRERRKCLSQFLYYFIRTEYNPVMRVVQLFYSLMRYRLK